MKGSNGDASCSGWIIQKSNGRIVRNAKNHELHCQNQEERKTDSLNRNKLEVTDRVGQFKKPLGQHGIFGAILVPVAFDIANRAHENPIAVAPHQAREGEADRIGKNLQLSLLVSRLFHLGITGSRVNDSDRLQANFNSFLQ